METIRLLVRNLVFLVILAAFLEMLLPLQGTRRFVQVIIGLFVVLAVLSPVVTLLGQQPPLHFAMTANSGGKTGLPMILEQGKNLQQVTTGQEQAAYVQRLEDQIEVLCRLVPGVKTAKATVTLSADASMRSLGAVQKVVVELDPGDRQVASPVETVQIGQADATGAAPPAGRQEIAGQVRETVSSLFGLPQGQVTVLFTNTR